MDIQPEEEVNSRIQGMLQLIMKHAGQVTIGAHVVTGGPRLCPVPKWAREGVDPKLCTAITFDVRIEGLGDRPDEYAEEQRRRRENEERAQQPPEKVPAEIEQAFLLGRSIARVQIHVNRAYRSLLKGVSVDLNEPFSREIEALESMNNDEAEEHFASAASPQVLKAILLNAEDLHNLLGKDDPDTWEKATLALADKARIMGRVAALLVWAGPRFQKIMKDDQRY